MLGCGLCVEQCLGNKKGEALKMVNVHEELEHAPLADYIYKEVEYRDDKYPTTTVKVLDSRDHTLKYLVLVQM